MPPITRTSSLQVLTARWMGSGIHDGIKLPETKPPPQKMVLPSRETVHRVAMELSKRIKSEPPKIGNFEHEMPYLQAARSGPR